MTDQVTGQRVLVCSNCLQLPRCFVCGLPVKDGGIELPDGRHLCARDAKTAVLNADDAERIADQVHDDLDRLFSRFTSFPTNVDVTVLDRIDVDAMFQPGGYDFESPNLLGCIQAVTNDAGQKRYSMRLMTGLPRVELKATAAHELSHAWVGENVPPERHNRLGRDAEEGFCEMVAYLLMDAQHEDAQKQFILRNHYTRGQVQLFLAAEERYGFNQILDWMQNGESSLLKKGHLEEIRDVTMPAPAAAVAVNPPARRQTNVTVYDTATVVPAARVTNVTQIVAVPKPDTLRLQGILWGARPAAIINNQTVFANDRFTVRIGGKDMHWRCLEVRKTSVRLENVDSGSRQELNLQAK